MIIYPFDPSHFTKIQTNIQNGQKTTNVAEKADHTGKFDKFFNTQGWWKLL